ncbi:hypothetical protein HII17_00260 [Thalassotalea sp. M1531]|uniref:Uncharacterized protein n=1 Tax=Thalassotalea algicola TaxID=2716224 RepID=A0A7Y0L8Y0_9GAMM|nr:hypothetical protein [Thalassotalea algicola]NMP29977.1 hypothetical protein [Thalassotalea algicola]
MIKRPPVHFNLLAIACTFNSLIVPISSASSISLSATEYEDTVHVGENSLELKPIGATLFGLLDVTTNITLTASYAEFGDDKKFNDISTLDLSAKAWGIGISYSQENWLFHLDYGQSDEDITIKATNRNLKLYKEDYDSPSWSGGLGYSSFIGDDAQPWYWSLNSNIQYADWQRNITRYEINLPNLSIATSLDKGESWFASAGLSLSQFSATGANSGLLYGGSLSWFHLIDGESSAVSRNGRSVSQIASTNQRFNASNFSQQIDGEQYGLVTIFAGYHFNEKYSVELSYSTSFAADENADSINLSVSYEL